MRLDHLLSKEHEAGRPSAEPAQSPYQAIVLVGLLMEWNVDLWPRAHCELVAGTLLGPEGSETISWLGPPYVEPPPSPKAAGDEVAGCYRPSLENCTVDASIKYQSLCGQVSKGVWWMPRHQEPKKDVGTCDKPRGVGNRTMSRGCPNGETRRESCRVMPA